MQSAQNTRYATAWVRGYRYGEMKKLAIALIGLSSALGISFAVANMTGFVARFLEERPELSVDQLVEGLVKCQKSWASLR